MKRYKTILSATDFSKPADGAFTHALGLATACGARLRVVHVVPPYEAVYFEHVGATEMRGGENQLKSRLRAHVKKLLGRSRLRCTTELAWGEPAETLVNLAAKGPCDMLVMGARGLNPWQSLILGNVAERVVRHASVPTLVVNPSSAKGGARRPTRRPIRKRRGKTR
jgi:nucleotide-binding universal stress UspA family protein